MSTVTTFTTTSDAARVTSHAMSPATTTKAESPQSDDYSPGLATELQKLEQMFNVDKQKLKQITARFEEELQDGLQKNEQNISMNLTWVLGFPSGKETGSYLAVDLGGTNIRICWITLLGAGKYEMIQEKYCVPAELKVGTADQLYDAIACDLEKFVSDHKLGGTPEKPLSLAFTFSYPATQNRIDHGVLQRWTKGFNVAGCEGEDAAGQLRNAIVKRSLPIEVVALINDTTGALIASAYSDPQTIVGAIFGTGCNAAYLEHCSSIAKLSIPISEAKHISGSAPSDNATAPPASFSSVGLTPTTLMAINCEYGAFDNERRVLPLTPYDEQIDRDSPRPGQQMFEKMSAGLYLGEIFRLVLIDLYNRGLILQNQDISRLSMPYTLDTGFLANIENDFSHGFSEIHAAFRQDFALELTFPELRFAHRLAEVIAIRGARLCSTGIAAICAKKNVKEGHVAADGSVANKHPKFKARWAEAMGEILGWDAGREKDPIEIVSAEDGSGVGAAVIAAMSLERKERGELAEMRPL